MKKPVIVPTLLMLALLLTSISSCVSSKNITMAVDWSDISRFYNAIETAEIAGVDNDDLSMGRYLYKHYVQKGSLGLKHYFMGRFVGRHDINDIDSIDDDVLQRYGKMMKDILPFLKANRKSIEGHVVGSDIANEIIQNMYAFLGDSYLDALSGKQVNFIIGAGNMGGSAFMDGVFIDASMIWSEDMGYKGSHLEHFSSTLIKSENIDFLIAHEMIHTLQSNIHSEEVSKMPYPPIHFMLELAIIEGGADFLASLVAGTGDYLAMFRSRVEYVEDYGEKKLLNEFLNDASEQAKIPNMPLFYKNDSELTSKEREAMLLFKKIGQQWFYNRSIDMGDRLPDLGYSMGYLIAKAYWDNNVGTIGESETFSNIIKASIGDAAFFLEQAGFSAN